MNPLLLALVQAGVITQSDAERINRSLDPDAARVWAERRLVAGAQGGLSGQGERLAELVRSTGGNPSVAALDAFWRAEDERLWAAMRPAWQEVVSENAVAMAVRLGADDRMWNTVNERMLDWLDDYYISADAANVGSIPNLNLTSRTQFGQVFAQWQRGELEMGTTAQGLPQLVEALGPVFGPVRAERIAVTETTRVIVESQRAASEADEFITHYRFLSAADERVCPICGPNHGAVIEKRSGGFSTPAGRMFPPLHPMCRCQILEETDQTRRLPPSPEERYRWSEAAYADYLRNRQAATRPANAVRTLTGG